jgi:hypothetical protein
MHVDDGYVPLTTASSELLEPFETDLQVPRKEVDIHDFYLKVARLTGTMHNLGTGKGGSNERG